jgi:hypothetical protein
MNRNVCTGALVVFAALLAGCASPQYKIAQASTADGSVLRSLNLNAQDVKYQAPCVVAVKRQTRARPLACVYVQTAGDIHFLRYNEAEAKYLPAVSVPIAELTTIALATYAFNRQIQVNRKGEILAFHIVGANFVNAALTEEIYGTLKIAGVPTQEPDKWIDMMDPVPMTITIPVYVGS